MRLIAHFHPQAWINDYAVDCDGQSPSTWDVTDYLVPLPAPLRSALMKANSFESDGLRELDAAPAWTRNWGGPFFISVEAQPETDADRVLLEACDNATEIFDWSLASMERGHCVFKSADGTVEVTGSVPGDSPAMTFNFPRLAEEHHAS